MLLLAATLAMPAPVPDDPAVAVCEIMAKAGLRDPASFRRTADPLVAGTSVVIAFVAADARGRPRQQTRACTFSLSGRDGRYRIEPFRAAYLRQRVKAEQRRLAATQDASASLLVQSQIIDIGREAYVQETRRKVAESAAARAGIYPIDARLTALGR
jgi:hypothetical protein